jgi:hypothetical protein
MSSTGGTSCGLAYANLAGNCCTAVLNGGFATLTERLPLPNLHNFLLPYFKYPSLFLVLSQMNPVRTHISYGVYQFQHCRTIVACVIPSDLQRT